MKLPDTILALPPVASWPNFLTKQEADGYYAKLKQELEFKSDIMRYGDKVIETKRKYSFHGIDDYSYAGEIHKPKDFTLTLSEIMEKIKSISQNEFNAVLCNYYEDNSVTMGWHADKEKELGERAEIVSVNLGQTREFCFRYRRDLIKAYPELNLDTHQVCSYTLEHGSALVMLPGCQELFEHCIKKTSATEIKNQATGAGAFHDRINLTYRKMVKLVPVHNKELASRSSAFTFGKLNAKGR